MLKSVKWGEGKGGKGRGRGRGREGSIKNPFFLTSGSGVCLHSFSVEPLFVVVLFPVLFFCVLFFD